MEKITTAIGAAFLFSCAIVIAAPLGALWGAIAGLTVGLAFPETMHAWAKVLGLDGMSMWQIGAGLGFFSSFLRTQTKVTEQ